MTSLDELVEKSKSELDELFREGTVPDEDEVQGATTGRVLAGRGALRLEPVRQVVNNPLLPWKGKKVDGYRGSNRFEVGPIDHTLFEFETYVDDSISDDGEVLVLDYDQPENPPGIRQIRDELRKVDDDLYLGTANVDVGTGHQFTIYFGLSTAEEAGTREVEIEVETPI